MSEKFISERNLKFLLYDVHHINEITQYPYYEEHSKEVFDMVLDTALKLSKDKLYPLLEDMDVNQPEFVDGHVKVHPKVRDLMAEFGGGGGSMPTFLSNQKANNFLLPSYLLHDSYFLQQIIRHRPILLFQAGRPD